MIRVTCREEVYIGDNCWNWRDVFKMYVGCAWMYKRYASDFHLPSSWISASVKPASRALVAAPRRNEWPE